MKITKNLLVNAGIALLSFIMFFMLFAPVISASLWGFKATATGFEAYLGSGNYDATVGGVFVLIFIILMFLCSVGAIVLEVLKMSSKNISMTLNCLIMVVALLAAILFFCTCTDLMVANASGSGAKICAAAVFEGIFALVICAAAAVNQFVLKD